MEWLQVDLKTVGCATNTTVLSVAKDTFFTMVEMTARNVTSQVRSKGDTCILAPPTRQSSSLLMRAINQAEFNSAQSISKV